MPQAVLLPPDPRSLGELGELECEIGKRHNRSGLFRIGLQPGFEVFLDRDQPTNSGFGFGALDLDVAVLEMDVLPRQ